MDKKYLLYLRTDICNQELFMGGSVGHTIGVIKGFVSEGYQVVCASSCMLQVLKNAPLEELIVLKNPTCIQFLRWKLNCLLSSLFYFFQVKQLVKKYSLICIYQRYSLLNMTGILLAWWYNKTLILEYNGSEVWVARNWVKEKRIITGTWLICLIENYTIKNADYLVVVSEVLKEELEQRGVEFGKILVNPNGVDPLVFSPALIKERSKV